MRKSPSGRLPNEADLERHIKTSKRIDCSRRSYADSNDTNGQLTFIFNITQSNGSLRETPYLSCNITRLYTALYRSYRSLFLPSEF